MAQAIDPTASPFDKPIAGPTVGQAGNAPSQTVQLGGGGGDSSGSSQPNAGGGWSGNFHADDLINQEYEGLNDQQRTFIRNQLNAQGLNEKSHPADFRKGLQALGQSIPGLGKMSTANKLFSQGADTNAGGWDPLAQQLFFFKTVAPYLDQIRSQSQSITNPLYAHALSSMPAQFKGEFGPLLDALKGSAAQQQTALSGAAAVAPSLDSLMGNVTAARQAEQKDFYEQQRAADLSSGSSSGSSLSDLMNVLGTQKPAGG